MKGLVQITNVTSQLIWLLYILNNCVNKNERKSKKTLIFIYLFDMALYVGIRFLTHDITKTIVINHIIMNTILIIVYSKIKYEIVIVFSMLYILMVSLLNLTNSVFLYNRNSNIFFIIFLEAIITFFILRYSYIIINVYKKLKEYKYSWTAVIISFLLDYIFKYYREFSCLNIKIIISVAFVGYILFFTVGLLYFISSKLKADTIFELHRNLTEKNNQLRKIKKNHENQITSLDYFSETNNFEEVGKYLKEIIHSESQEYNLLEKQQYNSLVLNLIKRHVYNPDINLVIEENCDLANISIPESELYRVMINIINNAIKAMNEKGNIKISVYKLKQNIEIDIENNGPEIKEEDLKHIFEEGFTTKENKDKSHGFGLSIVKDLVEKFGGEIFVESNSERTKFKMNFLILD